MKNTAILEITIPNGHLVLALVQWNRAAYRTGKRPFTAINGGWTGLFDPAAMEIKVNATQAMHYAVMVWDGDNRADDDLNFVNDLVRRIMRQTVQ